MGTSRSKKRVQRKISARPRKTRSNSKKAAKRAVVRHHARVPKINRAKKKTTKPIRRSKTRGRGYAVRKTIVSGRTGKPIRVNRRVSEFAKRYREKLSHKKPPSPKTISLLQKKTLDQFRSIGKSKNKLYIISFQYRVKVDGKWRTQYFSSASAKIRGEADILSYLDDNFASLYSVLEDYLGRGMKGITLTGLKIQGYE